ncbi:MAG: alpha/beta hydrolase [Opitutus sp.]|nr:alpha/beta hydrolase [Opitutus sp.]
MGTEVDGDRSRGADLLRPVCHSNARGRSKSAPLRSTASSGLWFAAFVIGVLCHANGLVGAGPRVIDLWPEGVPGLKTDAGPEKEENGRFSNIHHPTLTVYPPAGRANGTAVIYAAGGGYVRVAVGANGGEITRWLGSLGITVFVLKYRHADYGHPAPLRDALRSVRLLRSRTAEFGVRPDRIGMLGGSAGGHLTASSGTLFDAAEGRTGAMLDVVSGRPDFMVLVFPVISMQDPYAHGASRRALLGAAPSDELKLRLSVDQQITKETPPSFLVHSSEDTTVVVENSLLFHQGMRRAGAPIELHLYPRGPHGSGMSPALGPTAEWPRHCESWMRFNGWLPAKGATP